MNVFRPLLILLTVLGLAGTAFYFSGGPKRIAIAAAPAKTAEAKDTPEKKAAEALFWEVFLAGDYGRLEEVMTPLKAAYLENPRDPDLALHAGLLHLWRLAERFRLGESVRPSITDDMILARKYLEEAKRLNPGDGRINGWLGGVMMGEGFLHGDDKLRVEGYFVAKQGVRDYPAFNHFSFAYALANQPPDSPRFIEAIESLYATMDISCHDRVDRTNPSIAPYAEVRQNEPDAAIRRAVTNTAIAPFNVQGFYLAFGDFLARAGRTQEAAIIYQNAQLDADYERWPFRHLLEDRLANLDENVKRFRDFELTREALWDPDLAKHANIFNSYNCVVCHQRE